MKTRKILAIITAVIISLSLVTSAFAAPGGSGGEGGAPGGSSSSGSSSSSVTYSGATTITSAATQSGKTYTSTTADENALLISTEDDVTITNPTVTKSGDSDGGDNCNFYGINSGVMVMGGGTTTITGGTVEATAQGANGVFSYGGNGGTNGADGDGTTVIISDTVINTTGSNGGGIMTTGGGIMYAYDLTVTTSGGSSAPIRTDRGGGTVTVDGGTYTSSGLGSPAIYCTAVIDVSNATLVSKLSEGVCIEGENSVTLTDCDLTATNTKCNGNATFYDTIMIYQSQSGDAADGTSSFTMTGGSLTSNNGHVFHVTNTTAVITLEDVDIVNNDSEGILLSVCDDGWSGASNIATLNATNQTLEGDILVGSDSTLTLTLSDGSVFTGTISGDIENASGTTVSSSVGTVSVTLDSSSKWNLTEDTYISSFSGDASSVINNGYTLYVNGTALSGTTDSDDGTDDDDDDTTETTGYTVTFVTGDGATVAVYTTQDVSSTGTVDTSDTYYARNGDTGEIDTTGDGQVNFVVSLEDGYSVSSVTADANYKNVKTVDADSGVYRVTKITGDVTITIETEYNYDCDTSGHVYVDGYCQYCGEEDPDADWYEVTFTAGEGATVTVYTTQDVTSTGTVDSSDTYYARNSDTGLKDITGDGQINFTVTLEDGYSVSGVTAEGDYSNVKTVDTNTYRVTKIDSDVTITVETVYDYDCDTYGHIYENGYCNVCGEEDPDADWYEVSFELGDGASVTVYTTQDVTSTGTVDSSDTYYARNSDTGLKDITGDGQINFVISLEDGYTLSSVTADDNYKNVKEVDTNVYRVTKITGDVVITVATKVSGTEDDDDDTTDVTFTDVAEGSWYYDAVYWAVGEDITKGMTETTFEPDTECTRAMIVTFLYRAAGSPSVDGIENPFTDVSESAWYYDAVLWAVENGITKGMTDTTFEPGTVCTRAQTVAFLMRYTNGSASSDSDNPFTDVKSSAWYYDAVMWAVENDITNGMTATTFVPNGNCTRGQIVTFLYRAVNN